MIPVQHYLIVGVVLFCLGAAGVLIRRNVITMFMCVELMLNAANLTFVAFSQSMGLLDGQIVALFVMTVAAAEAAVGLAIIVALYRTRETLDADNVNSLKW